MNESTVLNADASEIAKFSALAHKWWDKDSEFKPLHQINPLRLGFIDEIAGLAGKSVLDVGCGGGILSEGMASHGAQVTGIDLAERSLKIARLHLHESGLKVDYRLIAVEDLAAEAPGSFDVVTCMEMLEHVPRLPALSKPAHVWLSRVAGCFSARSIAMSKAMPWRWSAPNTSWACCRAAPMITPALSSRLNCHAWRAMSVWKPLRSPA